MAKGRNTQLVKQVGEYLVACELARRHLLVATFSGNVPDFDIIAADEAGHSVPIQVKTIRLGDWQFSVDEFAEITFSGEKQVIGKKVSHHLPRLLHVMVVATEYKHDRFFILEWEQLRDLALAAYEKWLATKGGIRPKNFQSLHCSISPDELKDFENRWDTIIDRFPKALAVSAA
jgi:hypothetical protein